MSWDFWMEEEKHTCPICGRSAPPLDYDDNYTYNVSPMFYEAIEQNEGIRFLDGKTGKECTPILEHAIDDMLNYPSKYDKMAEGNAGWGDRTGAMKLLSRLLRWCSASPNAIMRVT